MTYRDNIEAQAAYDAATRAAAEQHEKYLATPEHMMDGDLKAMHARLHYDFKAKAADAETYLRGAA